MDDTRDRRDLRKQKTYQIQVSGELRELIESVASEFQITESEAVEELLHSILQLRRIVRADTEFRRPSERTASPHKPVMDARKQRIVNLATVIIAFAFALGAILAVLYLLLKNKH
jgi:hypothetical protein